MTAIDAGGRPVYWDASAILSALTRDAHSSRAIAHLRRAAAHLLSTLALAETLGGLRRMEALGELASEQAQRAFDAFLAIPWTGLDLQPDRRRLADLARRHSLRGADLWHLALALTLRADLPDLHFLTFDAKLVAAAAAEGLDLAETR